MDFLDPKKKRRQQLKLFTGYLLMATALTIATLVLAFATYGYGIDSKTGGIIQNGLITVDSHPVSADVYVNGNARGRTSQRIILPAGDYQIEIRQNGYRSWQHTVSLEGSSIEQLVYPVLFPQKLLTKAISNYSSAPMMSTTSPDRHWLVIQPPGTFGSLEVYDLVDNKNAHTTINLPSDVLTAATGNHSFLAMEWSNDNTHLLIKHVWATGSEFIMVDRANPASSINLNKFFSGSAFDVALLRDKKSDQMYLLDSTKGTLASADTKANTVTPLLTNVSQFKPYQANTILYVKQSDGPVVEVHIWQNGVDHLIRTLPKSSNYLIDLAEFNNLLYLATGSPTDGKTYIYQNPFKDLNHKPALVPRPFRVLIVPGAQFVSFSTIARFIAVQNGSQFAVYDAETGRQFRYDSKLSIASNIKAVWMDGHRLTLSSGGHAVVQDFDGTNQQILSADQDGSDPTFDHDYKALFTLAPSQGGSGVSLTRTELIAP